jgi:hypothetical protein
VSSTPVDTSLPQTVSNAGLRISLTGGARQGNRIWLNFHIESANPAQTNLWIMGGGEIAGIFPHENDIEAPGLRWNEQNQTGTNLLPEGPRIGTPSPPPPSPTPYPTPNITGYLVTLPYVLTGAPDQPVTVTIRRVRFNPVFPAQPPGKIISGTWRFAFVPASLASPTPVPGSSATP